MNKPLFAAANLILFVSLLTSVATAQDKNDWPQILGPNRDGVIATDQKLGWDGQPQVVWKHTVGDGFAGPVIADNSVIVFHRPGGQRSKSLIVERLNADSGKPIWKQEIPTAYRSGMDGDAGPKATPIVHAGSIYCHGPDGELACLSLDDGSIRWNIETRKQYKAGTGYFGCGSTPIISDGNLILNVGGREGASVVAFDTATGKEKWKTIADEASYSSPIEMEIDGQNIVVFLTRTRLVGIVPSSGKLLFSNKFGLKGPTAVAAMPVAIGDKVFANAAYRVGATLVDVKQNEGDGGEIKPVWSDAAAFASHYGTPMLHEGFLYGTSGREDIGDGSFRCIEAATGKLRWDQPDFPVAHTLLHGNQLLALDHQGSLYLIEATADRFNLLQAVNVAGRGNKTRAVPAFSNGRLFFRTNANAGTGELIAIQIAAEQ